MKPAWAVAGGLVVSLALSAWLVHSIRGVSDQIRDIGSEGPAATISQTYVDAAGESHTIVTPRWANEPLESWRSRHLEAVHAVKEFSPR